MQDMTRVNVGKSIDVEVKERADATLITAMTRSRIVNFGMVATVTFIPVSGLISYQQSDLTYLAATAGTFVIFWTSIVSYYFGRKGKDE
jgi:hypothetical protein